jgi:cytoskeletal protein RodZ
MYEGDQQGFDSQEPPEESSNRTFLIAAGVLGGLVLLSLACLAGFYFLNVVPSKNAAAANATAQAAQNKQVADALTATSQAQLLPTVTPQPTQTPLLPEATATITDTPVSTQDPSTATIAAAFTQAALAQLTKVPTSTPLPNNKMPGTGFADEYGAPGLMLIGLVLIVVIFLARRLRVAPTR